MQDTKSPNPLENLMQDKKSPNPLENLMQGAKSPNPLENLMQDTKSPDPLENLMQDTKSPNPLENLMQGTKSSNPLENLMQDTKSPDPPASPAQNTKSPSRLASLLQAPPTLENVINKPENPKQGANPLENILGGIGDKFNEGVQTLEEAQKLQAMKEEMEEVENELKEAMKTGGLDFNLFLKQTKMIAKLGSLESLLSKIPGFSDKISPAQMAIAKEKFALYEAMADKMTPEERENPSLIMDGKEAYKRQMRVANESGKSFQQVQNFMTDFRRAKSMNPDNPGQQVPTGNRADRRKKARDDAKKKKGASAGFR